MVFTCCVVDISRNKLASYIKSCPTFADMSSSAPITLLIHGGAGNIRPNLLNEAQERAFHQGLEEALYHGYALLEQGQSALDVVAETVQVLENNPLFNAGKGSVYTHEGRVEMDAAIMDGNSLAAGAIAGVQGVKNPIQLAKAILNDGRHVFLSGEGARLFAEEHGLTMEAPAYFETEIRQEQWMAIKDSPYYQLDTQNDNPKSSFEGDKKFGTVGAVALDVNGNLAAATSTGGMCNKKYGRIGDSPVIGAGTYANNKSCAISCTGHGEFFLRGVVAYDIACLMEYAELSVEEAARRVIHDKLQPIGGEGGLIALDVHGNFTMPFNSAGMYRGYQQGDKKLIALFGHELPLH